MEKDRLISKKLTLKRPFNRLYLGGEFHGGGQSSPIASTDLPRVCRRDQRAPLTINPELKWKKSGPQIGCIDPQGNI